jgi:hypothetical protein
MLPFITPPTAINPSTSDIPFFSEASTFVFLSHKTGALRHSDRFYIWQQCPLKTFLMARYLLELLSSGFFPLLQSDFFFFCSTIHDSRHDKNRRHMSFPDQIVSIDRLSLCSQMSIDPKRGSFKRALCSVTTSLTVLLINLHSYQCKQCLILKHRVHPRSILREQPSSTYMGPQEQFR